MSSALTDAGGEGIDGNMSIAFPSIDQLKRALVIEEEIAKLEAELRSVLGATGAVSPSLGAPLNGAKRDGRSGKRSAATRAKMAAAQQARWAKKNQGQKVLQQKGPAMAQRN